MRITTLLENASLLDQTGLEHGSPLITGGVFSNGGAADMNGWASTFQSEVRLLTINMTSFISSILLLTKSVHILMQRTANMN